MIPVIILAGGLGTRLGKITKNKPKALVKIKNKSFLEWQIEYLIKQKVKKITFCVGYKHKLISNLLYKKNYKNLEIDFSYDGKKLLGTGGAIKKAIKKFDDSFFILYGDSFVQCNLQKFYDNFKKNKKVPLMGIYKNNNKYDKSNVKLKKDGTIVYNKKISNHKFDYIDYGISIMNKKNFENINKKIFDLSVIQSSLSKNNQLRGYKIKKKFFEIGSLDGINNFKKFLKK